jgi:hypothetical protein
MSNWQYNEIYGKKYSILDENRRLMLGVSCTRRNGEVDTSLVINKEYENSILLVPEMIDWIEQARVLLGRAETVVNGKARSEIDDEKAKDLIELVQDIREYLRDVWRTE